MRFRGQTHDPGALRVGAAQVLQLAFFGGLAISVVGRGMLPAAASEFLGNNQMMTFATLFGCNVLAGKLINTGAFEVSYDDKAVWSKLETGRFPQLAELIDSVSDAAKAAMHTAAEAEAF
uniref:Selenoprotein T n=1 Tax=Calcidiscus leptoporus TaxID=127549 RepID=A0A7S0IS87_9EUKA|mmetsp:Transcript_20145/g.46498  ORF Transcript_20145/g.46498 Transcript_20145/m.46498 type:complete len:120 (+) Transcript_20145:205-564(+)